MQVEGRDIAPMPPTLQTRARVWGHQAAALLTAGCKSRASPDL